MLFKLALNNVKRSIKDYTIYFLTLTFGVCLFYVFNSMDSQNAMLEISKSQRDILKMLTQVMAGVSVFISVILGFLIIYANKFLIKRRKKELGIYMTLGMERGKISRILMIETFIIGIFSLGVGLILGILASQGLSVVTAKLLQTNIKQFYFIFSPEALAKAILYFGIIFLVVMIFNTVIVSKYKLIDLIYGGRRNEKLKIKNIWVSVVLFLVSVICLGFAYYFIIDNGMFKLNLEFWGAILLGSIGTFLFFMSLSGFLLKVVQANKRLYFKGLNMFVLRQINSKINTTHISMTMICLMLLIAIGTLSSGMGMAGALTGNMEESTPYDISFYKYYDETEQSEVESIKDRMYRDGVDLDSLTKETSEVKIYEDINTTSDIFLKYEDELNELFWFEDVPLDIVSVSDYNHALAIQGHKEVVLEENEFAVNCNFSDIKDSVEVFLKKEGSIIINGVKLEAVSDKVRPASIITTTMLMDAGTIIVPDRVVRGLNVSKVILNLNYKYEAEQNELDMNRELKSVYSKKQPFYGISRIEVYEQGEGINVVVSYFTMYIGIIFLITCAAVLALQQLSESSDNLERYSLLRKIGVEENMMNKSIYMQVFIYFMIPLFLAIIHAVIGLKVANNLIKIYGHVNAMSNIAFTAIIILIIYGGYFIATCIGSRNMVKSKNYS